MRGMIEGLHEDLVAHHADRVIRSLVVKLKFADFERTTAEPALDPEPVLGHHRGRGCRQRDIATQCGGSLPALEHRAHHPAEVGVEFLQPLLLAPGARRTVTLIAEPRPLRTAARDIRRARVDLVADSAHVSVTHGICGQCRNRIDA